MQAKRFIAADMRRALDMVRDELGEDAMILSTQRTAKGVELVVTLDAVPTDPEFIPSGVNPDADQVDIRQQVIASAAKKYELVYENDRGAFSGKTKQQLADEMESARQRMLASRKAGSLTLQEWANGATLKETSPTNTPAETVKASPSVATNATRQTEAGRSPIMTDSVPAKSSRDKAQVASTPMEKNADIGRLENEISSMRTLLEDQLAQMAAMQTQQNQADQLKSMLDRKHKDKGLTVATVEANTPSDALSQIIPVAKQVRQQLENLGLNKACNDQLMSSLHINDQNQPLPSEDVLTTQVLERLSQSIPSTQVDPVAKGGVYAFLGITGVGKTTTIAKLAARYVMEHGSQEVVLLTTDTYRIASHHQLHSLASILNVTVKVVEDLQQLPALVEESRQHALVLIDTPGMSYSDPLLKSHLQALNKCKEIKNILVLSASSQYQVMKAAIHSYREATLAYCVMSKLDECAHLGDAMSVLVDHDLPLAYITDGQSVPEDIDILESSQLVARAVDMSKNNFSEGNHLGRFSYPSF